jgi:hypothetical protein
LQIIKGWWFMVFDVTFHNISVISWRFYWWGKPEYPEKTTDLPQVTKPPSFNNLQKETIQILNILIQNNPIFHVIVAESELYFSHFIKTTNGDLIL